MGRRVTRRVPRDKGFERALHLSVRDGRDLHSVSEHAAYLCRWRVEQQKTRSGELRAPAAAGRTLPMYRLRAARHASMSDPRSCGNDDEKGNAAMLNWISRATGLVTVTARSLAWIR